MPTTTRARERHSIGDRSSNPPGKKRRSRQPSTHKMRTRARAKTLDLFAFPPEIRNLVYAHIYSDKESTEITKLRLPSSIRVPRMFTEALPIFFESTPVTIRTRSNWCIRRSHLHGPGYMHYASTGKFDLPELLSRMDEATVRFRKVCLEISCCCCDQTRNIAKLEIQSAGQGISCVKEVSCRYVCEDQMPGVIKGLERMLDRAEKLVKVEIEGRDGFNGFSMDDLKKVAMCFREEVNESAGYESEE